MAPRRRLPTAFKAFRQFNPPADAPEDWKCPKIVKVRSNVDPVLAPIFFTGDHAHDRVARALSAARALPVKELVECAEMFERIRKPLRGARRVVDYCAGHGFLGMLFGFFERSVEEVLLVDHRQPPNFEPTFRALCGLGPWLENKVSYREESVLGDGPEPTFESDTLIVAAHACGILTDKALDAAIHNRIPVAVMPCCYPERHYQGPYGIAQGLGVEVAFDVHRTYRLDDADYDVKWSAVPKAVTPMNRILIARPR